MHTVRRMQLGRGADPPQRSQYSERGGKPNCWSLTKVSAYPTHFSMGRPAAAVKATGTIFTIVYRLVPRLGHAQAIGAIAHRLCRLIWKFLHQGIRFEERGPGINQEAKQARTRNVIRELRSLGYRVERLKAQSGSSA